VKFLIDECLTTFLVAVAENKGFAAVSAPHFGMAGWQDRTIAKAALDQDFVLVTNNRRDFLKLYRAFDIHPGMIIIIPKGNRQSQMDWFGTVLDYLQQNGESMINRLVEVSEKGIVLSREWHEASWEPGHIDLPPASD